MTRNKTKQQFTKRYFTLEQAEKLLPRIQKVLAKTITLNKALDLLGSIEIEVFDDDYNNLRRVTKLNKQFHKLSYQFYNNIGKLEDMGCLIKDLEAGVIDFYSMYDGREIFLCWKLGEQKIGFWHEIDDGFGERRPIVDLQKKK